MLSVSPGATRKSFKNCWTHPFPAVITCAGAGSLGPRGDHPVRPDLVSELHHVNGQITRITRMNLDVCFFNPALILSYAWQTPLVTLRKPDTHAIHLRAVRVPAVPDEDRKG